MVGGNRWKEGTAENNNNNINDYRKNGKQLVGKGGKKIRTIDMEKF